MKKINRFFSGVCVLISLLSACTSDYAHDYDSQNTSTKIDEYWMFIGNLGTGKTTIIKSLLKATKSPNYPQKKVLYMEHPEALNGYLYERIDCAKEIEEGFKENAKYRIFFVIQLNETIIRPEDLSSIEMVLDAIDLPNIEFNIIINKFSKREDETYLSKLSEHLNSAKYKTDKIIFIDFDSNFYHKKTSFLTLENNILDFMYKNSASIFIPKEKVGHINVDKWYERVEDMKQRLRKI